jgi:serine/threonine protein kinase
MMCGHHFHVGKIYFIINDNKGRQINCQIEFTNEMVFQGTIDPAHPTPANQAIVDQLLVRAVADKFLLAGFYAFQQAAGKVFDIYESTRSMSVRNKANTTYCDFIDAAFDSGAFGQVSSLTLTRKVKYATTGEAYMCLRKHPLAAKIQVHDKNSNLATSEEYRFMKKVGYFNVRDYKEIVTAEGLTSYFAMKKFPGINQERQMDLDRNSEPFTIAGRLALSVRILRELKRHFHSTNHLLHCDIKAANIVGNQDATTRFWSLKFIDLGFTQDSNDVKSTSRGSLLYMAPETFKNQYNELTEVYSAARLIGELCWRDKEFDRYSGMSPPLFSRIRSSQLSVNFKMFDGIAINQSLQTKIRAILHAMTVMDTSVRWGLDQSISAFEDIMLEYNLSVTPVTMHADVRVTYQLAVNLANELDEEYKKQHIHHVNVTGKLRSILVTSIKGISDDAVSIRLFKELVSIQCLNDCIDKQSMLTKINYIILTFSDTYVECGSKLGSLESFYADIKGSDYDFEYGEGLECFLKEAAGWQSKISQYEFDLDNLVELTDYMQRKMIEIDEVFEYHRDKSTARPARKLC